MGEQALPAFKGQSNEPHVSQTIADATPAHNKAICWLASATKTEPLDRQSRTLAFQARFGYIERTLQVRDFSGTYVFPA
jgi:hypothetical protein